MKLSLIFAAFMPLALASTPQLEFHQAVDQLAELTKDIVPQKTSVDSSSADTFKGGKTSDACWKKIELPGSNPRVGAVCPANFLKVDDGMCVSEACPESLPFQCGIFCTSGMATCTKEIGQITSLIFELIQEIAAGGRLPGAIMTLQKLYALLKKIPKCKNVDLTPASIEKSPMEAIQEFVRLFRSLA